MQSHTSRADSPPVRVVFITLDRHIAGAIERARQHLQDAVPNLVLDLYYASDWATQPDNLTECRANIAKADIIIATMLFVEEHVQAVHDAIAARRETCDAVLGCVSAAEIVKLTKLGRFDMSKKQSGPLAFLKKLRGKGRTGARGAGAGQMAILRQLPRILRFIPGTAQDVRAYFISMQYWLAGSEGNLANLILFLVNRYSSGPREGLRGHVEAADPIDYPDVGLYHPRATQVIGERLEALPAPDGEQKGTVGLLLMRSYVLADDTGHYDGVIAALEARGLKVVPAFASGLDSRPAIDAYFMKDGTATVDAVLSLTGFSLVGGPAYNDAQAAEETLARLDVPYLAAHALEFQALPEWRHTDRGLMPIESTIMVAIPEIDGATSPTVFGGRIANGSRCDGCDLRCGSSGPCTTDPATIGLKGQATVAIDSGKTSGPMMACPERVDALADRVARLVALRRGDRAERKLAIVLFNFPPNAGATGTAAYLSVFESLHNILGRLREAGYTVDVPDTVDDLRTRILEGNAADFGADANVHAEIPVDDHVRREPHLSEIEAQWGPAPGRQQTNGRAIQVLGHQLGNVLVAVQPGFGYEGDPMRLLFEQGFAPTHAFSAFYRYLREDFAANAVVHFGTHGALEFMPGKQTGLTNRCWPERLIGDLPNIYLYAANNPSEGAIAKRRSAATLVSYLTPAVAHAGLYRGLADLKASLERWRACDGSAADERTELAILIGEQAQTLDLIEETSTDDGRVPEPLSADAIAQLRDDVLELEYTMIPHGLHVVGEEMPPEHLAELLQSIAEASHDVRFEPWVAERLVAGDRPSDVVHALGRGVTDAQRAAIDTMATAHQRLMRDGEVDGLIAALDGRFIAPVSGGDVLRTIDVLPTGRNIHGFDPFRLPSAFAVRDGARQADRILERHAKDGNVLPETVAMVLWGTDNLKSEGAPLSQALALIGATPRFDGFGRLAGADLISLEDLGRPRIDVVMTLSGIFRDLLPLQIKLLAEAAQKAAMADEPDDMNYVAKHARAYARDNECDLATASLRVFSNADGAYGANVNQLVDSGAWSDEDELADVYETRKCFAYGVTGQPVAQKQLLSNVLATVDVAYQNLESVELGVTTIDHYFDTLGGIGRAVRRARGGQDAAIYIGDQTRTEGKVRSLSEQVALETRTRMLNPKWTEGLLKHGYEGVRQIEAHVTNTVGWSATTGQVAPWVYQQLSETYVLDAEMRRRLADLNPKASARMAQRLIEAHERNYWTPDDETLEALREAGDELDDRVEGIGLETEAAA